ncbi:hypothetical protein CEXT_263471 [Caerostris extrusa]|uniref:Ycf15 n=1 Tax=Caerostris extrusa TaxID=172846 RepID=A0AAV4SI24_CAEEX|nr:hypothetical protein CEXT_263471 [Caerostris extrusa]
MIATMPVILSPRNTRSPLVEKNQLRGQSLFISSNILVGGNGEEESQVHTHTRATSCLPDSVRRMLRKE